MNGLQFATTATTSLGFVESSPEEEHVYTPAQWSRVIVLPGFTQSQILAIKRLIAIRGLPHNWDSYESPPPSDLAIAVARQILLGIDPDEIPAPRVLPVSGGGVQLEWDAEPRELELEVSSNGTLTYLKVESGEPVEENEMSPSDIARLSSLLRWVVAGVSR